MPSPSDPASEKVVCERDVQAHQARSSPGATQKAGLLTSTTSLVAGDGGRPPRMALMRSSCVRQSNVWDRSRLRPAHCPCRSWVKNGCEGQPCGLSGLSPGADAATITRKGSNGPIGDMEARNLADGGVREPSMIRVVGPVGANIEREHAVRRRQPVAL